MVILHCDMNNFYASVECLFQPALRDKPVAVAGDPLERHGIVLAKNNIAKQFGVQTGDALWMARQKCPDIVFTPPHYDRYIDFSQMAHEIYEEYTDQVESFGLDECWLDVTNSEKLYGCGKQIADELRARIRSELGITASVGVSYNKIFAKLGSDLKKPDATTVIGTDFREKIWHLPANMLLYVGQATYSKLLKYGIRTIGDLAQTDLSFLERLLGKNGIMLWCFANGLDTSPVSNSKSLPIIKTIGNSTTAPRDLVTENDIKIILYILSESVAERMRMEKFYCRSVQITIRDNTLPTNVRGGSNTQHVHPRIYSKKPMTYTKAIFLNPRFAAWESGPVILSSENTSNFPSCLMLSSARSKKIWSMQLMTSAKGSVIFPCKEVLCF